MTSPLGPTGGSSNVQLNVTALAQRAVASSASALDLLISAHDAQYDYVRLVILNVGDRPSLRIDSSTSTAGSGDGATPNFVDDGAPLMSGDFVLAADLTRKHDVDFLLRNTCPKFNSRWMMGSRAIRI